MVGRWREGGIMKEGERSGDGGRCGGRSWKVMEGVGNS